MVHQPAPPFRTTCVARIARTTYCDVSLRGGALFTGRYNTSNNAGRAHAMKLALGLFSYAHGTARPQQHDVQAMHRVGMDAPIVAASGLVMYCFAFIAFIGWTVLVHARCRSRVTVAFSIEQCQVARMQS